MQTSEVVSMVPVSTVPYSPENAATESHPNEENSCARSFPKISNAPENSTEPNTSSDYMFDNLTGWRQFRVLRPCRGMYHDIRRRLPYYQSDITDAFTYRTIASTVRMYFVKFEPLFAKYSTYLLS